MRAALGLPAADTANAVTDTMSGASASAESPPLPGAPPGAPPLPGAPLPAVTITYRPVYLFDRIGGFARAGLPPWLLACLFLTPPLVRFLRKVLRIA